MKHEGIPDNITSGGGGGGVVVEGEYFKKMY
jgi:hypothetical protein